METCLAVARVSSLALLISLSIPTFVLAEPASGDLVRECRGCHGEDRSRPSSRFPNGLGRWGDMQCYGCHAELNDVAEKHAHGVRDPRYYAVPVSEKRLETMVASPLSYMIAPENLDRGSLGIPRISRAALGSFLRRPAAVFDARGDHTPRMIAVPGLDEEQLTRVFSWISPESSTVAEPAPLTPTARARAKKVWRSRCAACHDGDQPRSGRSAVSLALYTPAWLEHYASGRGRSEGDGRQMPDVELGHQEAEGLHLLLGEKRAALEQRVDREVQALRAPKRSGTALPADFVPYLLTRFFSDGGCVHCHVTSPRAASKFVASAEGLREYLHRKSGVAFWRRLETRAVETKWGLGAQEPGMPMGGPAIPAAIRRSIGQWVEAACPDLENRPMCPADQRQHQ